MNVHPLVIALLVATAPAWAQTPTPASTPATPHPESSAPALHPGDDRPSSRDPRVCLEFPTREQTIACAERFRSRRGTGKG